MEDDYANGLDLDLEEEEEEEEEYEEEEEEEEEEEDMEGYPYPIGPMPQIVSNDLRSLDEMVNIFFIILLRSRLYLFNCLTSQNTGFNLVSNKE